MIIGWLIPNHICKERQRAILPAATQDELRRPLESQSRSMGVTLELPNGGETLVEREERARAQGNAQERKLSLCRRPNHSKVRCLLQVPKVRVWHRLGLCSPSRVSDPKLLDALEAHPHTRFWSSEELSTVADWGGAGCWGRMINQNYVRMKATSSIAWSLIWSVYPNLECFGNGLLYAYEPWSGHYEVMAPLWTSAHTTQFTKFGWTYLPVGDAAGLLPEGGTYVTIASSDLSDFTIVIETLTGRCMYHDGCFHTKTPKEVQHLEFQLSDNLTAAARGRDLEVWATNATHWFQRLSDLRVDEEGILRISMEVDAILTISTLQEATKQGQGRASSPKDSPEIPQSAPFPLPFEEAFDAVELHRSPPFFADQGGTFEVVEDMDLVTGTRLNRVLQQQVLQVPIGWSGAAPEPLTLFGGTNWTDVDVEVSARFEGPTSGKFTPLQPFGHQTVHLSLLEEGNKRSPKAHYVGVCARVLRYTFFGSGGTPQGYCLQVTDDGLSAMWTLTASAEVIAAGLLSEASKEKIARKEWLQLRLEVKKARIRALIDGETVSNIIDTSLPMGQVALNCGYHKCQFDNIKVLPSSKNVTSFLATSSFELLKMYSPVTFHYDARTCDPSPAQTPKRDDFTGFVGLAFVPKVPVRLAALGRMVLRGGPPVAAVHDVELLEVDGKQLRYLASAAVPTIPSQQVGIISTDEGFQYAELRESLLLEPGHQYVLASSEISGGDFFYDKAVVAEATEGVEILGPAYSNESGWTFDSEPNLLFGPLNALLLPAQTDAAVAPEMRPQTE
eukprot:s69_g22.t3